MNKVKVLRGRIVRRMYPITLNIHLNVDDIHIAYISVFVLPQIGLNNIFCPKENITVYNDI